MNDDRRLIEDYLPIQAISAEASREKSVRKGHISTLHLWWARRPLVACRAAVYGALVPADQWVPNVDLKNPPADAAKAEAMTNGAKKGLNRRHAKQFVEGLCKYPGDPRLIAEAQKHILTAHAVRLTAELAEGAKSGNMPAWVAEFKFAGKRVTMEDIVAGRAPRPRVLDMFAGGGAIPLEALRLGCEAYALDLNPVAHIIQLCTLVYPQKYGRPDPSARGMAGPKNAKGDTTWGGLADEVRYWGNWVLAQVRKEIGDLYPPIPDPKFKGKRPAIDFDRETGLWFAKGRKPAHPAGKQNVLLDEDEAATVPEGYLMPIAYLWTRTVKCKNPRCGATVPLVRQTWLCRKESRSIAIRLIAPKRSTRARFEVVESGNGAGFDFDPSEFSTGGSATCPFCGAVAENEYVKVEGCAGRFGQQLMAVVCTKAGVPRKIYISPVEEWDRSGWDNALHERADSAAARFKMTVPDEPLEPNPRSFDVQHFGFTRWRDTFTPRQLLAMCSFTGYASTLADEIDCRVCNSQITQAVVTCLSMAIGRLANQCASLCRWQPEFIAGMLGDAGLPMILDFAEVNPVVDTGGSWSSCVDYVTACLGGLSGVGGPATVQRGSALSTSLESGVFDAIVTDPPYYDSRSYSNLSDHFYVWHKRIVGKYHPNDFAGQLTPKKTEAIAASYRHGGSRAKADDAYEAMMQSGFKEAHRLLKPGSPMVCVYAHKTTAGWATLINSLREGGFTVDEAWPVEMERKVRPNALETAALASSIFLVASKRDVDAGVGSYETDVRAELERIVRERVETLWEMEIAGADLVIACVGAGLRAFTRYARVEFANGEEVPAERFLTEVETAVLETILGKLSKEAGGNGSRGHSLEGVDPATRFYVLWRYTYGAAELDAGEAIIFANGTHVELEGHGGLSQGGRPLVEKKKAKYRLRDYTERGDDAKLGMPSETGEPAPLVDALHRTLWLMDNQPGGLEKFFTDARPNLEQIRLAAQALAGPALKGGELGDVSPSGELAALARLTANWRSLTEGMTGGLFGGRK